jgi:hypothetical protein
VTKVGIGVEGLVAWMEEHREAISGHDPTPPLLPQLPLFSDEQLRAAFRSMDPLAEGPARKEVGERRAP